MKLDFWGEVVPSWLMVAASAGTLWVSAGTLVAAVVAGIYAGRAAIATREQADAAKGDLDIASRSLALAEAEAREAREERAVAALWSAQRRADEQAPEVIASATPEVDSQHGGFGFMEGGYASGWVLTPTRTSHGEDEPRTDYRLGVRVAFHNYGSTPARIDLVNLDGGEVERREQRWPPMSPLYVMPGGVEEIVWRRTVSTDALHGADAAALRDLAAFRLSFFVRDIGGNVRDEYRFSGVVAKFERLVTRVVVAHTRRESWSERVAVPVGRQYERLELAPDQRTD